MNTPEGESQTDDDKKAEGQESSGSESGQTGGEGQSDK